MFKKRTSTETFVEVKMVRLKSEANINSNLT